MAKSLSIFILTISLYKVDYNNNIITIPLIIQRIFNKVHAIREINIQSYYDTPGG